MDDARLRSRLAELRAELARGGQALEELDRRRSALRDQLLRVHGAVRAIEELLAEPAGEAGEAPGPVRSWAHGGR